MQHLSIKVKHVAWLEAQWLSSASNFLQSSLGNTTSVYSKTPKPPIPPPNASGYKFQKLRNLVCVWIARRRVKALNSFLLSPRFAHNETIFHLPTSYQKPAILQRKAQAPTERQEMETLQTEKQMLTRQTPGYHRVFRMASIWEHFFFSPKRHAVTQDKPLEFIARVMR